MDAACCGPTRAMARSSSPATWRTSRRASGTGTAARRTRSCCIWRCRSGRPTGSRRCRTTITRRRSMPSASDKPITSRRGFFWTGAERFDGPWGTVIRAPMYVHWEAPVEVTHPFPIVLIHGGGGQGLDWMGTFDGRPGWSTMLVQRGYEVYVVDRPGHGRSSFHPDVIGPMGAPFPLQAGEGIFRSPPEGPASHPTAHLHTQWPGTRDDADPALEAIVTSSGPMPADLALSQALDQSRGAELLDRIGPAVLFTHSLGGPAGWLIADVRPDLVKAIVSIEAVGPPFAQNPQLGLDLEWGLTSARLTCRASRGRCRTSPASPPPSSRPRRRRSFTSTTTWSRSWRRPVATSRA